MPHRLTELGPQHHAAIRMRLEGSTTEQICEELGIQTRTLYIWFGDPLVKAGLAVQQELVNERFAERLAAATFTGVEELVQMVKATTQGPITPETKLKAIKELLDRAETAQNRYDPLKRSLDRMSDDDLLSCARALLPAPDKGTGGPTGES